MGKRFLTQSSFRGDQKRICGKTVWETWDFSLRGFLTILPSLMVLSSVHGLHHIVRNSASFTNLSEKEAGFTLWGIAEKWEDRSRHLPVMQVLLRSFASYILMKISEYIATTDKRHGLPLGGNTLRVKFRRKWLHGLLCLLFMGVFLTC